MAGKSLAFQQVHECEREFMDTLKIIVESGYSLCEKDFFQLLDVLEIENRVQSVFQLEQTTAFFMSAARELKFDEVKVAEKLTQGGSDR